VELLVLRRGTRALSVVIPHPFYGQKTATRALTRRSSIVTARLVSRQATRELRGGGTGGECPISQKEGLLVEYSKLTNGGSKVIARFVQTMSIFGVDD
jgi:hypothetical protein